METQKLYTILIHHICHVISPSLEGFGDFKIGGQIIHNVKYANELVLLAKEEKVLQDMIDKLIEIGDAMEWKGMWKKQK